ncbi:MULTISPECIES: hypothetical protein [unclassified Duganella]|uniref:hypothetical protein n=1 Tax=unclassified Duganella TaxID=2636909 RepID=UPI001113E7D0|nr:MULTISPECIES: hypothetical protein [unclassified Duganella]
MLGRGKNGHEHAYCYCRKNVKFLAHHTDGKPDLVRIPPAVLNRCKSITEIVSFHHNHPGLMPLSYGDLKLLGNFGGINEISAHTLAGGVFRARRLERWKTTWLSRLVKLNQTFAMQTAYGAPAGFDGALETHVFCLLLDRARLIQYDYVLDKNLKRRYIVNKDYCDLVVDYIYL